MPPPVPRTLSHFCKFPSLVPDSEAAIIILSLREPDDLFFVFRRLIYIVADLD